MADQKSLSAYNSRKGNNYVGGSIVNLATAKVLSGLAIKGGTVGMADKDLASWLKRHALLS